MRSGLRGIFVPLSSLYGAAISLRNFCYDKHLLEIKKLPFPVISVGNISVGGSGKTPFVMFLLEKFLSRGKKPAVLSRGYKRTADNLVISCPERGAEADVQTLGDEPSLISETFPSVPVGVLRDRYKAGLAIIERFGADVFILDDGFQNRELHRDIDFVLLNNSLSDLNDNYLPAGNLRDSRSRLRQADVIVLTSHGDWSVPAEKFIKSYSDKRMIGISYMPYDFVDRAGQTHSLGEIAGMSVAAFSGIAKPERFFSELQTMNIKIQRSSIFPDHHWFDEYDIDQIFGGDEDLIAVTTEKDSARIFQDVELAEKEEVRRIYALREKAVIHFGEEHVDDCLSNVFASRKDNEVYA